MPPTGDPPYGPAGPLLDSIQSGSAGPVGPMGPPGRDAEIDVPDLARRILEHMGVRPGDRLFAERDGARVQLLNPLDEEACREVLET